MKSNLKSEIELFKFEIRDCIRIVHISMDWKISETENSSLQKHQITKIKFKNSENQNKLILFGVTEKPKDSMGRTSFVKLISHHEKKSKRDCTVLWN